MKNSDTPEPGSPRKVVIDARVVVGNHGHGILRYTEELLLQLAKLQTSIRFVLLVNPQSPFAQREWPSNFTILMLTDLYY